MGRTGLRRLSIEARRSWALLSRYERVSVAVASALILASLALRFVLSWYAIGSNDATTWWDFAHKLRALSPAEAYGHIPRFNHPPAMAYYSSASLWVAEATALPFFFVFRTLPIVADAAIIGAIFGYTFASGLTRASWLAAAYAVNPVSILVSAYHGNTDCICVLFCFLSALLLSAERPLAAGLSLGAALNVKLIPLVLIVPWLLCCSDRRQAVRSLAGLAIAFLPFLPIFLRAPADFVESAVAYNSFVENWGIGLFMNASWRTLPDFARLLGEYVPLGRYVIVGVAAGAALLSRLAGRTNAVQIGAIAFSAFLFFAPGYGVQYAVYAVPFLIAVSLPRGLGYALSAGLFIGLIYYAFWDGQIPAYSRFGRAPYPAPAIFFGLIAWWILGEHLLRELVSLFRRARWLS